MILPSSAMSQHSEPLYLTRLEFQTPGHAFQWADSEAQRLQIKHHESKLSSKTHGEHFLSDKY
jgi:hypothetical protein